MSKLKVIKYKKYLDKTTKEISKSLLDWFKISSIFSTSSEAKLHLFHHAILNIIDDNTVLLEIYYKDQSLNESYKFIRNTKDGIISVLDYNSKGNGNTYLNVIYNELEKYFETQSNYTRIRKNR